MISTGLNHEDAFTFVQARRFCVAPRTEFVHQLEVSLSFVRPTLPLSFCVTEDSARRLTAPSFSPPKPLRRIEALRRVNARTGGGGRTTKMRMRWETRVWVEAERGCALFPSCSSAAFPFLREMDTDECVERTGKWTKTCNLAFPPLPSGPALSKPLFPLRFRLNSPSQPSIPLSSSRLSHHFDYPNLSSPPFPFSAVYLCSYFLPLFVQSFSEKIQQCFVFSLAFIGALYLRRCRG
jgi:hypothetical protein